MVPQDRTVDYKVRADKVVIDFTTGFSVQLSAECGTITYSLTGLSSEVKQGIVSTNQLEVFTQDLSKIGTQQIITVKSTLTDYSGVTGSDVKITVKFVNCTVTIVNMPQFSDMTYQIGSDAISLTLLPFESSEAKTCHYKWIYSSRLESSPKGGGKMEDYLTFDTSQFKFNIYSTTGIAQTLKVYLVGTLDNGQIFDKGFEVKYTAKPKLNVNLPFIDNLPPEFEVPLVEFSVVKIQAESGQFSQRLQLGKLVDYEGDPYSVSFSGLEEVSFLQPWIDEQGYLNLDIDYDEEDATAKNGIYKVQLQVNQTLGDDSTNTQLFHFTVKIEGIKEKEFASNQFSSPETKVAEKERPALELTNIDRFGVVEVRFSEILLTPREYQLMNETHLELSVAAWHEDQQPFMGFNWTVE